jgi:hypothetical protein
MLQQMNVTAAGDEGRGTQTKETTETKKPNQKKTKRKKNAAT